MASVDVVLYIGNLSISTTEDELKSLFMRAGDVTKLTIMRDGTGGESKGHGAQSEAVQAVSSFNACTFNDQILDVSLAGPRVCGGKTVAPFEF